MPRDRVPRAPHDAVALLVGVNHYEAHPARSLRGAHDDAAAWGRVLVEELGIPVGRIVALLSPPSTRPSHLDEAWREVGGPPGVRLAPATGDEARQWLDAACSASLAVIVFAGHSMWQEHEGTSGGGVHYLCMRDFSTPDRPGGAIPLPALGNVGGRRLVILDTSGARPLSGPDARSLGCSVLKPASYMKWSRAMGPGVRAALKPADNYSSVLDGGALLSACEPTGTAVEVQTERGWRGAFTRAATDALVSAPLDRGMESGSRACPDLQRRVRAALAAHAQPPTHDLPLDQTRLAQSA